MRSTVSRSAFIPAGSVKVSDKKSDAVAYIYTSHTGRLGAMVFVGKQARPIDHFTVNTEARRTQLVANLFASRQMAADAKARYAAERANATPAVVAGDILVASWGYDQTNCDFFQVIAVKSKTVTLRKIAAHQAEPDVNAHGDVVNSMASYVVPQSDSFIGEAFTRICRNGNVTIDQSRHASKWNTSTVAGVPVGPKQYVSWYA